ncbi:MAG: RluA family pseudouridine synthase [Planctomycetota bacterium]
MSDDAPSPSRPTGEPRRLGPLPAELDGERLDRALLALLDGPSRTRIQERIRDGGVRVDGEPVRRPSHPVGAGQVLELLDVPRSRERAGSAAGLSFELLHEDEHLIVVDKPAGMVVHPSSVIRGGTVSELAVERFGPLPTPQGEDRPGVVHRLDADTSGVLVLARSAEAGEELVRQFHDREVEKGYLAIVRGDPRFHSDWIDAPLGRSSRGGDRMAVVPEDEGRAASTFYEVRERFGVAALLACRPVTGRTHQIRVHLESIDHPVVGDRLYTGRRGRRDGLPREAPTPRRQALHAASLALTHPATGERLSFEAPLPTDLSRLLAWLRARPTSGEA